MKRQIYNKYASTEYEYNFEDPVLAYLLAIKIERIAEQRRNNAKR